MRPLMTAFTLLALILPATATADGADDSSKRLERAIDTFIDRYDSNRDRRVTPDEYPDKVRFARLDRDGSGAITRGDFYRVEPPAEAMVDDPKQGPKNGGKKGFAAQGKSLSFTLMMKVTPKTWARLRPYASVYDLYWGDVEGIPAKVRGLFTTGKVPTQAEVGAHRAVMLDLRKADAKSALTTTRAIKAVVDATNAKHPEKGWTKRELVGYYTAEQLAAEADLSKVADVIMLGDETWSLATLNGKGTVKPAPYLGVVDLAGRMSAICLGTTAQAKHSASDVEQMIRRVVKGHKLTHVGFICGDDRLHVLLDVLGRIR